MSLIKELLRKNWKFSVERGSEPSGYSYVVCLTDHYFNKEDMKWITKKGFEYDGYQDKCFEKTIRVKGKDD